MMGQVIFTFDTEKDHQEIEMFNKTVDMGMALFDIHEKVRKVMYNHPDPISKNMQKLLDDICEMTQDFI